MGVMQGALKCTLTTVTNSNCQGFKRCMPLFKLTLLLTYEAGLKVRSLRLYCADESIEVHCSQLLTDADTADSSH